MYPGLVCMIGRPLYILQPKYTPGNEWFWTMASANPNPHLLSFFETHLSQVNPVVLSRNPLAHLIRTHNNQPLYPRIHDTQYKKNKETQKKETQKKETKEIKENEEEWALLSAHQLIHWERFSASLRPNAIAWLIRTCPEHIHWGSLSANPCQPAVEHCIQHLDRVVWSRFSANPHPLAIQALADHPDRIDWSVLASNRGAISLLRTRLPNLDWLSLSDNPTFEAVDWFVSRVDRAYHGWCVSNPCAIHVWLSLDYPAMKRQMTACSQELTQRVFHPERIQRILTTYGLELEEYLECV